MLPHVPQVFEFVHIKSWKDIPHLLIVFLLLFGIGLGVYLSLQPQIFQKQAQEGLKIDLKFIPENLSAEPGRDYETKIALNPKGNRVSAVKLNVSYDPQAISVLEVKNGGFLPVELKVTDDYKGKLTLIYGSTIESQTDRPGMLSVIKFKVLTEDATSLDILPGSEVSVSSQDGNVLNSFPKIVIERSDVETPQEEIRYPDNLLLEKAFFASSEPAVRDFKESLEPKPELKEGRISPQFSIAFIKQLGTDIFISPIAALNQVLEEKTGEILGK